MNTSSPQILAIHHLVHEYANFVSSAELTIHGRDKNLNKDGIRSPLNHHVSHAFYLNSRKLADFFQNRSTGKDDVIALHFVSGFQTGLPVSDSLRERINKQLAHLTYFRNLKAAEITKEEQKNIYHELKKTWDEFCKALPEEYAVEVLKQIRLKKACEEFKGLPLE